MKKQALATTTSTSLEIPCKANGFALGLCYPSATAVTLKGCSSVAKASTSGMPSLMTLKVQHSEEKVHALIATYLVDLNTMLGLKRPLSEVQIDFVATELLTSYHWLTIADVHVVLRRAMGGYYGEYYESVNPPKVLKWFAEYEAERCEYYENKNIIENASNNGSNALRGDSFDGVMKSYKRRIKGV